MVIRAPDGDLSRAPTIEPNMDYPDKVELRLVWIVDGQTLVRRLEISADEFFGRGAFGAPIPAEAIIQRIDMMRRKGPPVQQKAPLRGRSIKKKGRP